MAKRSALIAASSNYTDPKLNKLRSPATDADELARVLRDPAIGNFDVRVLPNLPDHVIRREIGEFFSNRSRDDLLLLHFSCHGVKDDDGNLYFAAVDTSVDNLDATAVSADWVNKLITKSWSRRVVLLLDCCYSGAFAGGMSAKGDNSVHIMERFEGDGSGRVVLTASNAMEYAWEGETLDATLGGTKKPQPSIFTSFLVQGLESGAADLDQDGWVSVDELYDYVYKRVIEATPNQKPGKWSFDVEGDLHIARSKFISDIAALPPELRMAIANPLPLVRQAAVQELGELLRNGEPNEKKGARAALVNLKGDGNAKVAAAAADTLEGSKSDNRPTIVLGELKLHAKAGTFGRPAQVKRSRTMDPTPDPSELIDDDPPVVGNGSGPDVAVEIEPRPPEVDKDEPAKAQPPEPEPETRLPNLDWLKPVHLWIAGGLIGVAAIGVAVLLLGGSPPAQGEIIFTRGGALFGMTADGGRVWEVPGAPANVADPAWSPDGSRIAFIADHDVFVMDADGSNEIRLTSTDDLEEYHPAWSPDGTEIAFGRGDPTGIFGSRVRSDIWVVDLETDQPRQITTDPDAEENGPTWSDDGTQIAFRLGTPRDSAIAVVSSSGEGEPETVVDAEPDQLAPAWSPGGSTIVFSRGGALYKFDIDGDRVVRRVLGDDGPAVQKAPAWSPDGKMLVFQAEDDEGHVDLYRVNLDGSGLKQLTNTDEAESSASWFIPSRD
jgi:Caspase domain/Dipeptidyl peptidase IV (DPP IV) N-terminal region/WD40-like Beta Propeller Repeat